MNYFLPLTIALAASVSIAGAQQPAWSHGALKVSSEHRFLVHADGTPFFYLGDTAWELFHRLNREEAEKYLENRRQKRFTVVQAVVLAELDGLSAPNPYGEIPLTGRDPGRPNEAYFTHVDWIVRKAAEKGLYIGMLPTWGDKVVKGSWEKSAPVIFNTSNAHDYGRFLGARYKSAPNIIWILGGDRDPAGVEAVWREMARGLREGDGGGHLITFHPNGGNSSSISLHRQDWLDFNLLQSGHAAKELPNYEKVAHDYALSPTKPVMDGEPRYEDHPVNWQPEKLGWFDDYDARQAAYWAVFAGAHGHTYGCHPVWQMLAPGRKPVGFARHNWFDVLDLPGAAQMRFLRDLIESRPFLSRAPDQSRKPTRGDGYAFVYVPAGKPVKVQMGKVSGKRIKQWWYDPRTGQARAGELFENSGTLDFVPPGTPGRGNDWVLVLDDYTKKFPAPGKRL